KLTNFYHEHSSYARASTGSCFAALREGYSDPMMPLKTANTTALPIQSGVIKTVNVGNTAIMVLAITKLDPIPIRAPTPQMAADSWKINETMNFLEAPMVRIIQIKRVRSAFVM